MPCGSRRSRALEADGAAASGAAGELDAVFVQTQAALRHLSADGE